MIWLYIILLFFNGKKDGVGSWGPMAYVLRNFSLKWDKLGLFNYIAQMLCPYQENEITNHGRPIHSHHRTIKINMYIITPHTHQCIKCFDGDHKNIYSNVKKSRCGKILVRTSLKHLIQQCTTSRICCYVHRMSSNR